MNDLFQVFKSIGTYIDKLLVLIKGDWNNRIEKSELTLAKLKEIGLKCNI